MRSFAYIVVSGSSKYGGVHTIKNSQQALDEVDFHIGKRMNIANLGMLKIVDVVRHTEESYNRHIEYVYIRTERVYTI